MGLEPTTPALQERCATNCAKSASANDLATNLVVIHQ
jgi:hypothetical protein